MSKHMPASMRREAEALAERYRRAVNAGDIPTVYPEIERETQNLIQRMRRAGIDPSGVREMRSEMSQQT